MHAFRVTLKVKTLLRALAQRKRISESALVRQLVETMPRTQAQAGFLVVVEAAPLGCDASRLPLAR
jgi:hypothetical protein